MAAARSSINEFDGPCFSESEEIFDDSDPNNAIIKLELMCCGEDALRHFTSEQFYEMSLDRRGRCLIINNYQFKELVFRHGSQMDATNLKAVFEKLEFSVTIKDNCKGNDFVRVLDEELSHTDHVKLGMFVFILMSHGGHGGVVYGTDDVAVNQHDILKSIYNCKALQNKPKLIIVKACAGDAVSEGSGEDTAATSDNPLLTLDVKPSLSNSLASAPPEDVLFLSSSFHGFASVRNVESGSPFIRALVEALYKHAYHTDLTTLYKQVLRKIKVYNKKVLREKKNIPVAPFPGMNDFLSRKLMLFPGISSETLKAQNAKVTIENPTRTSAEGKDGEDIFDFSDSGKTYIEFPFEACDDEMKALFSSDMVYQMSKGTRGRCLIINNKQLQDSENDIVYNRKGSEIDVANLQAVFSKLKFEVILKEDLSSHCLIEEIKAEVFHQENKKYGMFILIIMTNGDSEGRLYGSDMGVVTKIDVMTLLYQSPNLNGKPKLLIIQASAGAFEARYDYDMASPQPRSMLSTDDVIMFRSAMDGFQSIRNEKFGAPFIRALVEALYKHSHHWHIEKIFKQVQRRLRTENFPTPEYNSCLLKKLFLFPKFL